MMTVLIFIAVLAVLVLSHEWGHFIAARKSGMKVEEFGFGFPPRLFGVKRVQEGGRKKWRLVWRYRDNGHEEATLYTINLLPLGGFVKIKGEESTASGAADPDSFNAKPLWQKLIVLLAGVAMNAAVAWVLLSLTFMIGLPSASAGAGAAALTVVDVLPGKPADRAGLKTGDVVKKVGNLENPTVDSFQKYISESGQASVMLVISRQGKLLEKTVDITVYEDTGRRGIGIAIVDAGPTVRYPWYLALWEGLKSTIQYLYLIIVSLAFFFRDLFTGGGAIAQVSGPVGIAAMTGDAARLGLPYLLHFTALISLNLAVLNALPIPAIDGGRVFFLLVSKILRRPAGFKYEQLIHTITFFLLLLLIIAVTIKDINVFKDAIF